jgi:hypothetical protein
MTQSTISKVKEAIRARGIADVALTLFPNAVRTANSIHMGSVKGEKGQSMSIEKTKGFWKDHATGDKGADLIALWKQYCGLSTKTEAALDLAKRLGIELTLPGTKSDNTPLPVPPGAPPSELTLGMPFPGDDSYKLAEIHDFRDEANALLNHVLRFERPASEEGEKLSKKIVPYSFDPDEKRWRMKAPKWAFTTLYRLQELATFPDKPVLLVEGEKTADAAADLFPEHVVVTWPGGSSSIGKVNAEPLKGRDVVLWPDNDGPGKKTVSAWQMKLADVGASSFKAVDPSPIGIDAWDLADPLPDRIEIGQMLAGAEPIDLRELRTFNRLGIPELVKRLIYVGKLAILVDEITGRRFELKDIDNLFRHADPSPSKTILSNLQLRKVEDVAYRPKGSRPIVDLGDGMTGFNTWIPTKLKPEAGNPFRFIRWVRRLCDTEEEARLLLYWLAHLIQHPDRKIKFAVVLVGKQGTGKSLLARTMAKLVGSTNFGTVTTSQLKGDFNSYMDSRILNVFEEAIDFERLSIGNKLKDLITEPTVTINDKYLRAYELENYVHFMFLTNHANALMLTADDRRYLVINCGRGRPSPEYFKALVPWIDENLGVILGFLEGVDLSGFNPNEAPPMTRGKQLMIELAQDPLEEAVAGMIEGRLPPFDKNLFKLDDALHTLRQSANDIGNRITRPKLQRVFADLEVVKLGQKGTQIDGQVVRATLWACRDQDRYLAMSDRELIEVFLNVPSNTDGQMPF